MPYQLAAVAYQLVPCRLCPAPKVVYMAHGCPSLGALSLVPYQLARVAYHLARVAYVPPQK